MKIAMVIQNFYPSIGGAERQALTLAQELVKKQVKVTVLTQRVEPNASQELIEGVDVRRLGCGPWSFMVKTFFWLLQHRNEIDVIHAHIGSSHAVAAALAGRYLGKKVIIKLSGSNVVGEIPVSRRSFIGRMKLRAFGWLKPVLILVSSGQRDDLHGFGLESLETHNIPNGVDTQKFQPADSSTKEQLRKEFGWSGVTFLFVGRFSADKLRLDIFTNVLNAWARLQSESQQPVFYLVGSGDLESVYRTLIQKMNLQDSVHLWPASERVRELYQAADVFVLPSVTEGLSNALLEALACGLPVAGSRVAGIQDLIEENVQGRLFDPLSVEEIYQNLVGLLRDAELRRRLGQASVKLSQQFSIQNSVERHLALYQGV